MIKVISFDLDGTLVKSGFGDAVWLEGLPKQYAKEKNIPFDTARSMMIKAYEMLGSGRREWYDLSYWIDLLQLNTVPEDILKQYADLIELYPDVQPVIKRLLKDFILIISSGAMREFITMELTITKLDSYFKKYFSSTSDTKMVKKDPAFYKMISDHMNIQPSEIVHIGDNKEFDYISPKKAGMNAYFLSRESNDDKDFVVNSLFEFEKIMRGL